MPVSKNEMKTEKKTVFIFVIICTFIADCFYNFREKLSTNINKNLYKKTAKTLITYKCIVSSCTIFIGRCRLLLLVYATGFVIYYCCGRNCCLSWNKKYISDENSKGFQHMQRDVYISLVYVNPYRRILQNLSQPS